MKIVNIIGGLGNQMFQIALAIALKEKNVKEEIKLDISHFNHYGLHNGFEASRIFSNLDFPIASKKEIKIISWYIPNYKWSRIARRFLPHRRTEYIEPIQNSYIFDKEALLVKGDCYFEGYWMSPLFFDFCRNKILNAFQFSAFDTKGNIQYENKLAGDNTVSIHIRRGDYLGAPNFKDICTFDYYRKAILTAKEHIPNPEFFIFSNDQEWCMKNLKEEFGDSKVHFITNNKGTDSYRDMQLMSLARCNILANSSFSWWAAYLNSRKDKIVCVPRKWINNFDDKDVYVDSWIKI